MGQKYVILPSSGDINRGDQALTWETMRIVKDSGFNGSYYILSENLNSFGQSDNEGLMKLSPILRHPSRKFKNKNNIKYTGIVKVKWGVVASIDFLKSILILNTYTRKLVFPFMSQNERETLKIMSESEICLVKGGGFLHSSGRIIDSYIIYFQLFHIKLALSLGKPVYVMPNSFGPFNGFFVKRMVRSTLNKCKLVTARESISKKMLDEISVKSRLFPDLGFSLNTKETKVDLEKSLEGQSKNRKRIGITVRPYRFPNSDNPQKKYENYIESMVAFTKWLYAAGYLPIFIEQVLSETTHESDMVAILEITKRLNRTEYVIISDDTYDSRDLKTIYGQMDYTVGTRFHSVIFSLSENVPCIAIEYGGNKGTGILKDMDLSQYGIPIEEISFDNLKMTFEDLIDNSNQVKEKISIYMDHVHKERKHLIKIIKEK